MRLGAAMNGGHGNRRENDFYPTPPDATRALLSVLGDWPSTVWEPACGTGDIARVLGDNGFHVVSTDLIDRGYGGRQDFLTAPKKLADSIITNPPFKLAEEFIEKSFSLGVSHLALLLKSTYWHASGRYTLFNNFQPCAVYPLTWRLDFTGQRRAAMEAAWFVWKPGTVRTEYSPLLRPAPAAPTCIGVFE